MASTKPSLIFDHSPFQNKDDLCKNSFLGGVPELPEGIEWPRSSNDEPLHFLVQVDFDDVNESCNTGIVNLNVNHPKSGKILLFVDATGESLWDEDEKAVKVIYLKNDVISDKVQPSPIDLKSPLLGTCANYSLGKSIFRRIEIPGRMPRHFPKANISMRVVNSRLRDYESPDIYLSDHFEVPRSIEGEFNYERNRHLPYLMWPWLIKKSYEDLRRPTVDVPECYPWNWYVIERTCQEIHSEAQMAIASSIKLPPLLKKILDSTIIEAEQWIDQAALKDEYAEISSETSIQFNIWLKSILNKTGKHTPERKAKGNWTFIDWISPDRKYIKDWSLWDKLVVGVRKLFGIERKLDDKLSSKFRLESMLQKSLHGGIQSAWPYIRSQCATNNIPKNIVDRLNIDCMPLNYGDGQIHYMFGDPVEVQDLGNIPEQNILLLQIASDKALNLMWGDVGILQIWIKAKDLESGNFENITFTADCH